ncbi:MAG: hypothetical protein P8Z81_05380 [Deinococcales bacterium]
MQRNMTIGLGVVAIALGALAYLQGGWGHVLAGLAGTGRLLLETSVLIVAAFVLAGLIQVMISRELVSRWLGAPTTPSPWRSCAAEPPSARS